MNLCGFEVGLDRPLAERHLDRAPELVAVERDAAAGALEHGELAQLHALEGGEAFAAFSAITASPDRGVIFRGPRVLDLCVDFAAMGTPHSKASKAHDARY